VLDDYIRAGNIKARVYYKDILTWLEQVQVLFLGNTEEKASAAKTVWILSFSDQNKPKINSDRSLIEALDVVAQSENP